MKIVQVIYQTKASYVEDNIKNIQVFMSELRHPEFSGINYTVCLESQGNKFIHTAYFNEDADQTLLNNLPSFKEFQQALKTQGLETPPQQNLLTLVGTSQPLFSK